MGEREYCSSENSPKTVRVVLVYITGHGIFKIQCTLHIVWGKVTVITLCILILFLNKKPKLRNAHNIRHFNFFIVPPYCPLKIVQ